MQTYIKLGATNAFMAISVTKLLISSTGYEMLFRLLRLFFVIPLLSKCLKRQYSIPRGGCNTFENSKNIFQLFLAFLYRWAISISFRQLRPIPCTNNREKSLAPQY